MRRHGCGSSSATPTRIARCSHSRPSPPVTMRPPSNSSWTEPDPDRPWYQAATRRIAALGAGRIELALVLIDAVRGFEEQFARLRRDVDRISASDDTNVRTSTCSRRAHSWRGRRSTPPTLPRPRRGRSSQRPGAALALAALLADASDHTEDEGLISRGAGRPRSGKQRTSVSTAGT